MESLHEREKQEAQTQEDNQRPAALQVQMLASGL